MKRYVISALVFSIVVVFLIGVILLMDGKNRVSVVPVLDQPVSTVIPTQQIFVPSPLTLDTIFSDYTWTATLSAERLTTVIATGDVLTAREVNRLTTQKENFHWPFEKTAEVLQSGDVTIINLETPLVENCPTTSTGMIFCGDTRNIEGLIFAGVDVINLANNHMGN